MSDGTPPNDGPVGVPGGAWGAPPPVPPAPDASSPGMPPMPQSGQPGYGQGGGYGQGSQHGDGQQRSAPSYATPGYGPSPYAQPTPHGQPVHAHPGMAPWQTGPVGRPGTVLAGAIMTFIGAAFLMLFGAAFAIIANDEALLQSQGLDSLPGLTGTGLVFVVVAVVLTVLAVFALRGQFWAAITLAAIGGVWAALCLLALVDGQPSVIVSLVYVTVACVLLLSTSARRFYTSR